MKRLLMGAAAAAVLLVGCGNDGDGGEARDTAQDVGQAATETVLRNAASVGGKAAFEAENVNIDGTLDCNATADGDQWRVDCTGSTDDGKPVALNGTAPTDQSITDARVNGTFVGTVDGNKVIERSCLGRDC